jgi:hypothetical protein
MAVQTTAEFSGMYDVWLLLMKMSQAVSGMGGVTVVLGMADENPSDDALCLPTTAEKVSDR